MKNRQTWMIVAMAAAVIGGGLLTAHAQNALRKDPAVVAVVDVVDVINNLREKQHIEADLNAEKERIQGEREEKRKELLRLQEDLKLLDPGSAEHGRKQQALEKAAIEVRVWENYESQKLQRLTSVRYEALYRKMIDTIGKIADQGNIDIVLFKERPPEFPNIKPEQLVGAIQVRKVLWSRENLDITQRVRNQMDNEFNAG